MFACSPLRLDFIWIYRTLQLYPGQLEDLYLDLAEVQCLNRLAFRICSVRLLARLVVEIGQVRVDDRMVDFARLRTIG